MPSASVSIRPAPGPSGGLRGFPRRLFTLAVGIGATAAIFTLVDAVLLRPCRIPSRSFERLGMFGGSATLTGGGEPAQFGASRTTAGVFDRRRAGRVLSDWLWGRRFGSAPSAWRHTPGRRVSHRVVRTMPPDFRFPSVEVERWVPMTLSCSGPQVLGVGAARPGAAFEQGDRSIEGYNPAAQLFSFLDPKRSTTCPDYASTSRPTTSTTSSTSRPSFPRGAAWSFLFSVTGRNEDYDENALRLISDEILQYSFDIGFTPGAIFSFFFSATAPTARASRGRTSTARPLRLTR